MGLCRTNKAKAPSKRAMPVGLEAREPAPVNADVPREEPSMIASRVEADEEILHTPRSENDRNVEKDANATDAVTKESPSRGIGAAGVHGNSPPTRHDSSATSCAGMTDADCLSRRGTQEAEQPTEEPAPERDTCDRSESTGQPNTNQYDAKELPHPSLPTEEIQSPPTWIADDTPEEREAQKRTSEGKRDTPEPKDDDEFESPASDFTRRVHETFTSVKQSLSRGFESLRPGHVSDSIRRASTGDFTEMHPAEQCVYGVLNDITEFGERTLPCVLGEHSDDYTENPEPPMPQVVMIVNTPGGPYIRRIPDELVGDAINMGFITEEEVQRQREEWERSCGRIPVEYTPAVSFAEQTTA